MKSYFKFAFIFIALLQCQRAYCEKYVAVLLGTSRTAESNLHIKQASSNTNADLKGVEWAPNSFQMPPYYVVKIGDFLKAPSHWGVELDFTHYKVYAKTKQNVTIDGTWNGAPVSGSAPMDDYVQKFNISHGVNTIALNVLYRWRLQPNRNYPDGRLQPYVGGGPAYYILHPENDVNNVGNDFDYEASGIGWQMVAGARYGVSDKSMVIVEMKYSDGHAQPDIANNGSSSTWLSTWQLSAGMQYDL
jgi:opacity protein-like surface antigen